MGKWRQKTIGDLVTLQRGIDLPDVEREPGSVPIMGSFGITGRHSEAACKGPGVTLGRSGASAGVVCYIKEDFWPLNTCLYVKDFKGNHPRFAYYMLKTFDLASLNSGSAQPSLNRNFVHPVPASFPEPLEQQAIASVLGALDDKIELNRRMNETLEAMARAIFKDWFVDIGPTRAKMEGRAPYLAPELWRLFPDKLDEEGKPIGWKMTYLSHHASITKGRSYTSSELAPSDTALVTLKSFARGGGYRRDGLKAYTGTFKEDQVVTEGDIVISQTDVTQAADIIGRPARVTRDSRFRKLVASLDVAILRPLQRGILDREFLYALTRDEAFTRYAISHSSGTTVLHLSKDAIPNFEFLLPEFSLIRQFSLLAEPITNFISNNVAEIDNLAATRDLLLPKLMSGEIRIRDAEKAVAEVA